MIDKAVSVFNWTQYYVRCSGIHDKTPSCLLFALYHCTVEPIDLLQKVQEVLSDLLLMKVVMP